MEHALSACFLVYLGVVVLSGCAREEKPVNRTDFVLDTVATVSILDGLKGEEAENALDQVFEEIKRYEGLFSTETESSDVWRINSSRGEKTVISPETAELIDRALYYCELSDGAFDITIRKVSKLWDFRSGEGRIPEKSDIDEALAHVDYRKISLDKRDNSIILSDPEMEIDLGGIAKGYIADRIKELLICKGVTSGIINLGGNVLLIGSKPGNEPFSVGIEKPFGEGEMIKILKVSDTSMVTSGNYQRYFYSGDRLFHHILDTKTGFPVESGLNAVTVITDSSVDADALSTVFFCLGTERGKELIKRIDKEKGGETEVYFTDTGNHITKGN